MSESIARVYTNTSRRANHKQSVEHKPVYRSVLGNPFHVDWPVVPSGLQKKFLIQLTALFEGVAAYYQLVGTTRKKRRIAASSSHEVHVRESNQELPPLHTSAPSITQHIKVGINEVTKALEMEVRSNRQTIIVPSTAVGETRPSTRVVFICHADLDTPALIAHLPQLVALCNSVRTDDRRIKVVQLPSGAQTSIASSLGYLKRVSVMALDDLAPGLAHLEPLLASVPNPPASWMIPMQRAAFEPSHVKQILTTAPKDMKAAKERRARGRAAAKERKKKNTFITA